MDSRQPFPTAWGGHTPVYNQQVQELSGESSNNQLGFGSFAYEPPYQNPFQGDAAVYDLEHNHDVPMAGHEVENRPAPSVAKSTHEGGSSRRTKYVHLDWNTHKPTIQRLYMDENKSLSETMERMKSIYSFDAS
jgi:Clr5 domain